MSNVKIFTGTAHPPLAERIADTTRIPLGDITIRRFPDGEIMVRVDEHVRGADVFVVQSICNPPNENLMELLIIIDAMRRASAGRITAVIPYFGYARQDRKDQPRVPITAKLVANLLVASGVHRILTIDLHAQQIQGFFDIPVDHLYALPIIVKHLESMQIESPVIVSPDTGGVKAAYAYARAMHCELAVVAKQRMGHEEVEAYSLVGDVDGRTAIMVDDMTTTAGTLCSAARLLIEKGAKAVFGAVTHATITTKGMMRLKASPIRELVVTDTVPLNVDSQGYSVTVLTVSELLGEAIIRIHEGRSVTTLFRT